MKKQGYEGNWITIVCEHLVRAGEARLMNKIYGVVASQKFIKEDKYLSWFYLENICKLYEKYEQDSIRYPTFETLMPDIIQLFSDLDSGNLPDDYYVLPYDGSPYSIFHKKTYHYPSY